MRLGRNCASIVPIAARRYPSATDRNEERKWRLRKAERAEMSNLALHIAGQQASSDAQVWRHRAQVNQGHWWGR